MLAFMRRQSAPAGDVPDLRVHRAAAGDRQAFEQLMHEALPQVWRVVWRILRHDQDTEDVVQEVFIAAHQGLQSFRGEARFSTWLHRIAVNRALNHRDRAAERIRRASRSLDEAVPPGMAGAESGNGPVVLAPAESSPLHALEMKELKRRLAECLEKLPAAWRAVLALRDGEALSYQAIAETLDTALGTVRSRLARARLFLRRCVEGNPT